MKFVLRGAAMVWGDRSMWRYVIVPMLWSALLYVAIVVGGYFLVVPLFERWLTQLGAGDYARAAGSAIYAVLWLFLSGVVFLSVAGMMSSLFWDGLSRRIEEKAFGSAPEAKHRMAIVAADSMQRMVFSIFAAVFAVLLGWCFFGIVGVVLAGWLGLYDYTACAFLRRGVTFSKQMGMAFRCKGWAGFALVAGLLTLLPFVNVLMLPSLVAGGTLLCAESFPEGMHKG